MKKSFFLGIFFQIASVFGNVILTDTLGEYFDTQNNSTERYIYGNLNVNKGVATLHIFSPRLTEEVAFQVRSGGLARIEVKEAIASKKLTEIQKDKYLDLDVAIKTTPNKLSPPGYQVVLSVYGQTLNTNILNIPNPVQYFLLQMVPLTSGIANNVFCDLLFQGGQTDKWLVPAETNYPSLGVFLSQTWKTNQIIQSKTNSESAITLTLRIPATSFVNLQDGDYQIRIAAIMGLPITTIDGNQPDLIGTQINSLLFLISQGYSIIEGKNGIFKPSASQISIVDANIAYLVDLIEKITLAQQ